jgi:YesN/AraC family two-component response regulator
MISTESKSALSLLLVEDDVVTLKLLGIVINRKFPDLTIYSAENGRMGVDLFKEHMPVIIVTDINMPAMGGIEMAGEIKSIRADTRFIVMTAHSDRSYLEKFSAIGFSEYLLKPIQFKKLFAAIERAIAEITMERH